jgi:hypothetical protein
LKGWWGFEAGLLTPSRQERQEVVGLSSARSANPTPELAPAAPKVVSASWRSWRLGVRPFFRRMQRSIIVPVGYAADAFTDGGRAEIDEQAYRQFHQLEIGEHLPEVNGVRAFNGLQFQDKRVLDEQIDAEGFRDFDTFE